jgi:hypothetical protein
MQPCISVGESVVSAVLLYTILEGIEESDLRLKIEHVVNVARWPFSGSC